jgi:hypothetical protein
MIDALPLLLGPEGYQISRSVRLRSSASAYFSRTPASAGNRRTWTWSGWVKRGSLGGNLTLFSCGSGSAIDTNWLGFLTGDALAYSINDGTYFLQTTQVFRDPSAWYHIILATDTTQATASNRAKLYVNGIQITAFATATYPVQNLQQVINAANLTVIGAKYRTAVQDYFDGYITEVNFIDGQQLTPSSFGETDVLTGVWKPKKYTGTYGTNGFYLNFSDNSAATAAAIGKDYSGNGNNWTPNNISVTAGVTYDSMLDVPTQWADGGNGRGNYAVMNPVSNLSTNSSLSNGNLQVLTVSSGDCSIPATIGMQGSGKYYAEFVWTASGTNALLGIIPAIYASGTAPGYNANSVSYRSDGLLRNAGSSTTSWGATWAQNDVMAIAFDAGAGTVEFYKNNVKQGSTLTGFTTDTYFFAVGDDAGAASATWVANFGQRPFAYTPPTGFKALNTLNLPAPTILKGNQYMNANIWTGDGSSNRAITGVGFQPDFTWIKIRNLAFFHRLTDSIRGATKELYSNATDAEFTQSQGLLSFDSDGFTIGTSTSYNGSGNTYVGWSWKEGATQGFDIVTYTGNGANRTIAHNLGVAPSMMIVKGRSGTGRNWAVYHKNLTSAGYVIYLNLTNAQAVNASAWNSTAPTSSVFSVGTDTDENANGETFVAYLFSEVAGFSKAFSYTGNGSADGPFVFLGFRPRFIMLKRTDATSNWLMIDTERSTYNQTNQVLLPNSSAAEATGAGYGAYDFLSNGFKPRNVVANETNVSGGTYIGFAWAEVPFKNSLAR